MPESILHDPDAGAAGSYAWERLVGRENAELRIGGERDAGIKADKRRKGTGDL